MATLDSSGITEEEASILVIELAVAAIILRLVSPTLPREDIHLVLVSVMGDSVAMALVMVAVSSFGG